MFKTLHKCKSCEIQEIVKYNCEIQEIQIPDFIASEKKLVKDNVPEMLTERVTRSVPMRTVS